MSKVVAFVPIKLNSQRLPGKNLLPLGKNALCWHIFEQLKKCANIDQIYVYCSDPVITDYIPEGVTFLQRPGYLDGDEIKGAQIYQEFISQIPADIYVLAHATSPLICATSISNSIDKVLHDGFDSAFSVSEHKTFAWYDGHPVNYDLTNVVRTQDLKPVYLETSAFFVFRSEIFLKHGRRIGFNPWMCILSEKEAVDIDTASDYELAKYYFKEDPQL